MNDCVLHQQIWEGEILISFTSYPVLQASIWALSKTICSTKAVDQLTETEEYADCISTAYDTKQSDDEASVMLELWEMWSTTSLPSLPGPLWSGVVAPGRVLSMGRIEVFDI